jgi:hypothetical protein
MLVGVAALMLVVGVPVLHAWSKAASNRANIQQIEVLDGLLEDGSVKLSGSVSSGEVQRRLNAPVMDEIYAQFLHSVAVLTIAAGAILAIAFYVRYQIGAAETHSAD